MTMSVELRRLANVLRRPGIPLKEDQHAAAIVLGLAADALEAQSVGIANGCSRLTPAQIKSLFNNADVAQQECKSPASFARVVALVEAVHRVPNELTPDTELSNLAEAAMVLCEQATRANRVITIERRALKPLAMGHAEYVVTTRDLRVPQVVAPT